MSSNYVRTMVRGWLETIGVPFFDTENQVQRPNVPNWVTVEWGVPATEKLTFCGNNRETAEFNVVFLGRQGIGDAVLLALADPAITLFAAKVDASGLMELTMVGAPTVFSDDKNYFCVSYPCQYEYQPV